MSYFDRVSEPMYINFWYPVCTTDELSADAPLPVRLLGQRLAVFRDSEGKPHVLSDTCIHRGGSLGHGKVNGDCIECPYHGWQYDADGKCQLMPSEDGMKPPARAKVDSYPTEERYGVVFAFLGDLPENERPPLYEIEEFDSDEWRPSAPIVLNANCYYERSVENGIDPVHNQFVHPAQGYPPMHKETFRTWDNEWGTGFDAYFGDPVLENTVLAKDRNVTGELKAGSWFHGPNVLVTSIFVNAASNLVQYLFEAPIDRDHTKIYFINMRNFILDPELDEKVMEVNLKITAEDIGILEQLYPVRTPDSLGRELMTSSDAIVIRYREWLGEWKKKGWLIDQKILKQEDGDVAYAIPSPARRESGNWVLESVPLVPGEE
ncbi:MAG: phenylpropionate dioxygenase-like ring-hydroxylating dioxygenase large terminal subunit [Gammaproteobacteria bacterium]